MRHMPHLVELTLQVLNAGSHAIPYEIVIGFFFKL